MLSRPAAIRGGKRSAWRFGARGRPLPRSCLPCRNPFRTGPSGAGFCCAGWTLPPTEEGAVRFSSRSRPSGKPAPPAGSAPGSVRPAPSCGCQAPKDPAVSTWPFCRKNAPPAGSARVSVRKRPCRLLPRSAWLRLFAPACTPSPRLPVPDAESRSPQEPAPACAPAAAGNRAVFKALQLSVQMDAPGAAGTLRPLPRRTGLFLML